MRQCALFILTANSKVCFLFSQVSEKFRQSKGDHDLQTGPHRAFPASPGSPFPLGLVDLKWMPCGPYVVPEDSTGRAHIQQMGNRWSAEADRRVSECPVSCQAQWGTHGPVSASVPPGSLLR